MRSNPTEKFPIGRLAAGRNKLVRSEQNITQQEIKIKKSPNTKTR